MLEDATTQGYIWLAKAVLCKALVDVRSEDSREDVLQFMRGETCSICCGLVNVSEELILNSVIRPNNQPIPVDIFRGGARYRICSSLNVAHLTTGDSITAIKHAMKHGTETKRGYKYRKGKA